MPRESELDKLLRCIRIILYTVFYFWCTVFVLSLIFGTVFRPFW